MARTKKDWFGALPMLVLAVLAGSCDGIQNESDDCDYILSAGLTTPTPSATACPHGVDVETDALCGDDVLMCYTVTPNLAQINPPVRPPSAQDNFGLASYDVVYINRLTGRSVPNVDVPRPFTFPLPFEPEIVPTAQIGFNFEVLTTAQKSEPPLNNPAFYPANGSGVDLLAIITFHGYPIGDPGQNCQGSFQHPINVTYSGANCP